ncbi:hypothetical protein BJ973_009002 [Actinoplanes tereljensis]|uniref:Uncharacterized protein n=1 Tax=Paractinoplanes tereljensis TaxID=571912 RepID=A0A919NHG4_9ACTN|nr:hypothetical protein [Actinoplanes tereljensis]GIF18032.1 hypothetical protein Ate02nite_07620 [Actinoplanes tereljensis]
MTRTTAKWVGYVSAPLAAICWCVFATTLSDTMWTFTGDLTDTDAGTTVGWWLGAAVILTVLAAASLIVASLVRAMEELTGYGPTR